MEQIFYIVLLIFVLIGLFVSGWYLRQAKRSLRLADSRKLMQSCKGLAIAGACTAITLFLVVAISESATYPELPLWLIALKASWCIWAFAVGIIAATAVFCKQGKHLTKVCMSKHDRAFDELCQELGTSFNWYSVETNNTSYTEEAYREITKDHPLYGKDLQAIAFHCSNDDVLFKADGIYFVIHLTYSVEKTASYPRFLRLGDAAEMARYIKKQFGDENAE